MVVTGTHTPTWFYCFGSLAAPRLSTPFPALPESHHPPERVGHPSSSHGVAHPLIRPSTPFGQTSTHRSRKPTPLPRSLPLPCPPCLVCALYILSIPLSLIPRPTARSILALVRPPSTRPTLAPSSLQARTDTSNAPALSHRLSDTHARHRYRWDTSTYYTRIHAPAYTYIHVGIYR